LDQLIGARNSLNTAVTKKPHRIAIKLPDQIKYFASKNYTGIVDLGDRATLDRPAEVVRLSASRDAGVSESAKCSAVSLGTTGD
jgi:hypothetical protein